MKTASLARWLSALGVPSRCYRSGICHTHACDQFGRLLSEPIRSSVPLFERATGHHLITTRGPSLGDSPVSNPHEVGTQRSPDA